MGLNSRKEETQEKCRFCENYEWHKAYNRKHEKEVNADREAGFKISYKMKASLIVQTFKTYKDGPRGKLSGQQTGRPMPLNYCPVCGRKLTGRRNVRAE